MLGVIPGGQRRSRSGRAVVGVHPAKKFFSVLKLYQTSLSNEKAALRTTAVKSFVFVKPSQNFRIVRKFENLSDDLRSVPAEDRSGIVAQIIKPAAHGAFAHAA